MTTFVCSLFHPNPRQLIPTSIGILESWLCKDQPSWWVGDFDYRPFTLTAARWSRANFGVGRNLGLLAEAGRYAFRKESEETILNARVKSDSREAAGIINMATFEPASNPPLVIRCDRALQAQELQDHDFIVAVLEPNSLVLAKMTQGVKQAYLVWVADSLFLVVTDKRLSHELVAVNYGRSHAESFGCLSLEIDAGDCLAINFQKLYNRQVEAWHLTASIGAVVNRAQTVILRSRATPELRQTYKGFYL